MARTCAQELDDPTVTRFDATRQHKAVEVYQAALAAAGGEQGAVGAAGQDALGFLVADLDGLLRKYVSDHLRAKGWGEDQDLFEDCLSEAKCATIVAAALFNPAHGLKFRSWILRPGGHVAVAVREACSAKYGVGLNRSERQAAGYVRTAQAQLRAEGVEPSIAQIELAAVEACLTWARERVEEGWMRAGRTPPDLDDPDGLAAWEAEREVEARRKVQQSGVLGALSNTGDLLRATQAIVSLDTLEVDPAYIGGAPLHESRLPTAEDLADLGPVGLVSMVGLSGMQRERVLAHLSGDGSDGARDKDVHDQTAAGARRGRAQLDEVLNLVRARMRAPHAHFAALSVTLDIQFEDTPAPGWSTGRLRDVVRAAR